MPSFPSFDLSQASAQDISRFLGSDDVRQALVRIHNQHLKLLTVSPDGGSKPKKHRSSPSDEPMASEQDARIHHALIEQFSTIRSEADKGSFARAVADLGIAAESHLNRLLQDPTTASVYADIAKTFAQAEQKVRDEGDVTSADFLQHLQKTLLQFSAVPGYAAARTHEDTPTAARTSRGIKKRTNSDLQPPNAAPPPSPFRRG